MVGWVSPKRDVLSIGRTSNSRGTLHHNLPAQRSSFVGRERETLEVKRELATTRLLTLTGAGGSGKTRLALEVARGLVGAYPDGVRLVELAPLSEEALVPKAVAEALKVSERSAEPLADTLADVSCETGGCSWYWTTASTSWRQPRSLWTNCSTRARGCGSWPPAAKR
jgi:hypothetical protein